MVLIVKVLQIITNCVGKIQFMNDTAAETYGVSMDLRIVTPLQHLK